MKKQARQGREIEKTNVLLAVSAEHATPQQDAARWLDMWETGSLEIQNIPNMRKLKFKIRSALSASKVMISEKKKLLTFFPCNFRHSVHGRK